MIQVFLQVANLLTTSSRASANPPQRLARWLDRPFFPWKKLVIGFSLAEFALENWLLFRQYNVLQRKTIPKALQADIDTATFDKSQVRSSPQPPHPTILTQ